MTMGLIFKYGIPKSSVKVLLNQSSTYLSLYSSKLIYFYPFPSEIPLQNKVFEYFIPIPNATVVPIK